MLKIPAKTFMVGEYLALHGGPAAIILTEPAFTIDPSKKLHTDSIAAQFILAQTNAACNWGLNDPYFGKGGLGASSAEYLLAYHKIYGNFDNLAHVHAEYIACCANNYRPSGYDVLAQTSFGCVVVETNPICVTACKWPFPELSFALIHTGKKLKTHEHLQARQAVYNWQSMLRSAEKAIFGLEYSAADDFLAGINDFARTLLVEGLVIEHTQVILQDLAKEKILAAKGCGALGSDIVLIVFAFSEKNIILELLRSRRYDIIATEDNLFF